MDRPGETRSLGGGCIENAVRGTDDGSTASSICAGLGRRLATAELDAFREAAKYTMGSTTFHVEWAGDIEVNVGAGAVATTDAGILIA
jgi:hypothetical protein